MAIKFLRADAASERVLSRFREEARILGLVLDRAIVIVAPSIWFQDEWMLVMEYMDGVSCAQLLQRGPLPARVAAELIGEVARALDVAWHQPGPDGQPLHLLHRDLKPGNLQITPTGHVKPISPTRRCRSASVGRVSQSPGRAHRRDTQCAWSPSSFCSASSR
ncbi:MAG: hypothetical protein GWP91_09355 [Rhodobacterales bacterium]|nr:hypothetical protein [Rhodobacterales bacterium]